MDITQQTLNLFITYVDKEGPFLKVWGQAEKNNSIYVEQFLLGASQQFEQGIGKVPFETLQVGTLVCTKYKDNKYYRARIVTIDYLNQCFVEVNFLDYGHKDIVPSENIRSLQNFPTSFISIPPLATGFIFAEAHCPGGGEWKDQIFEIISKELRYREVQCHLLTQATQYYLIRLYIDNTDIGALFINRGLMQPIPLHAQQAVLLSMSLQRKPTAAPVAQAAPPPTEINTYKACTLEPMQQYAVYVSFVNEGPTHFSVQLQQCERLLAKLMKEINEINLRMMEDVPLPGTICLARCQEDGNICRAVVTNEVDNQFKVFFVDFGNYETLPLECLYQIPFKYVLPKVMAIRLALNGVEKPTVTMEMLLAFKKFVDNRLLHMKVLPSPKKSVITKCELWDPETKTSALDVINRAAQHAYPEPLLLNRGFTQPVKVSYVFSCNRFYVQLSSKEQELSKLMEDLQVSCQSSDGIYDIKIGLPCCALFEADQLWYRSEVVDIVDKENVKVRYIDYGNEEVVPVIHLRAVEGELLTVLRPQAIECCLNGYQNMSVDEVRDALLEELILEQSFTMKVSEMLGKKALVELIDANNYNAASLLLDKIAASKSQVSPMLVQAGNTLEHRKSSDSSDTTRPQRKPARDWARNDGAENRSSDKTNDKSWRRENKDTRPNDINSNDGSSDNGSWRQNNKGFNNRNERNDRDRDGGDRGQRGDRPSVNERFNKTGRGNDNRNNNWNNKDTESQNSPSWSSPVNEAAPPAADGWGDSAPSPVQNSFENRKPREDRFGGRNKFDDRRDRGDRDDRGGDRGNKGSWGGDKGDKGSWGGDRGDRGDRGDKGSWGGDKGDRGDKGSWGGDKGDRGDKGSWGGDKGDRGDKRSWGGDKGDRGDKGSWGGDRSDRGDRADKGDWGGDKGDRGGWNNKDGFKRDGFKKDYRKDGSEMSSSGSEKSFRKGPRTSSRNDYGGGGKRFENRSTNSFANASNNGSWSVSDVSAPIDAAPSTASFDQLEVVGSEAAVTISWFHNPQHFYCQLQSGQPEFKTLMDEIQQFYKNRKPETCVVGAPIVGLFPEDNVVYRARVLEAAGGQYKILYVDFGNVSTVNKVWPIEKKFIQMPAQAICAGLFGVGPNGESWPDPSNYTKYFEREFFMARFLEKDEERTYVQLWDNQDDVSQLLVQANLAVPVAPPTSGGIEIPMLLNQQFRGVLKSVNNLSDVIVALECGLALTCKAHNLEMASESFEDVLKGYLEQILILYVDNILENDVLDVTFYDNEGNKLLLLTPDEGALDNVDPLCPILIISSTIYGYVSHANETAIFIQPSEYADQLGALLEQMYEAYEKETEETSIIIPEEGFIYAVHSADGNWYRGRVESFDNDKATVTYVDYGNGERVIFSDLRDLKTEFNVPNIMCLQVTVTSGPALPFLEKDVLATIYYGETGWEGSVQECAQTTQVEAEVFEEAATSASNGVALQEATLSPEQAQFETSVTASEIQFVDADEAVEPCVEMPQLGTPVYVSHIDSPTEFYVQFTESKDALLELHAKLQETAEEMPVLENISAGVLCAAPYSVDHEWYRATVLDADEDITTVRFVDYGNTDVINNKTTQVKTLPSDLLALAVYATRCSLKLKAVEEEWSQQALELFEALANGENVSAEFLIQDEKTNIVELFSNGEIVKDALLAQNLAVPCEIVTESKTTCFVSHLNSPSEFWVQMENCVDELEWIAEQLSGAEQFAELEDLAPGTLCAALFPDDEMWYRARILSNTIAGIELLFVDYGNSCVSSSLRQLPEDLLVTAPLAQKCCLQRPEGIPYWTKEAQDKFAEISAEGQTIFELKKISTGETAIVELVLNGENIVPRILPVTQDGCVKNFESLDKFSVETNGELLPETVCLEPMPGMAWDEASTEKFSALYPDGTVFQVELIAEDCVRLYKNGADIRPQLGGVKSNLNLSTTQEEKTDDLGISEDDVIDYEAGGDNLDTKHSIEDSTQDITSQEEQEPTEVEVVCLNEDQDSGHEESNGSAKDKSTTRESETDSGEDHSEQEIPTKQVEDIDEAIEEQKVDTQTSESVDATISTTEYADENVCETTNVEKDARNEGEKVSETIEAQTVDTEKSKNADVTITRTENAEETVGKTTNVESDYKQEAEKDSEVIEVRTVDMETSANINATVTTTENTEENVDKTTNLKSDDKEKEIDEAIEQQNINTETSENVDATINIPEYVKENVCETTNVESDDKQERGEKVSGTIEAQTVDTEKSTNVDVTITTTENAEETVGKATNVESDDKQEIKQAEKDSEVIEVRTIDMEKSANIDVTVTTTENTEENVDKTTNLKSDDKEKEIDEVIEEQNVDTETSENVDATITTTEYAEENVCKATYVEDDAREEQGEKVSETIEAQMVDTEKSKNVDVTITTTENAEETVGETTNVENDDKQEGEKVDETFEAQTVVVAEKAANIHVTSTPTENLGEVINAESDEKLEVEKVSETIEAQTIDTEKRANLDSAVTTTEKMTENVSKEDNPKIKAKEKPHIPQTHPQPAKPISRSSTPISHDDKILPGCVSRPHTPPIGEIEERPLSRPPSSQGRRVSHDEKIVPAVLSRPQTPIPDDPGSN